MTSVATPTTDDLDQIRQSLPEPFRSYIPGTAVHISTLREMRAAAHPDAKAYVEHLQREVHLLVTGMLERRDEVVRDSVRGRTIAMMALDIVQACRDVYH